MPKSVLDIIERLASGDVLRTTARQLGESESAISLALSSASAGILARLCRLSADAAAMNRIATLIEPAQATERVSRAEEPGAGYVPPPVAVAGIPSGIAAGTATRLGRGTALLIIAFGTRMPGFVEAVAGHCGLSGTSARAVIGHAASLVLRALGIRLTEGSPEPFRLAPAGGQLADLLAGERAALERAVPPTILRVLDRETETISFGGAGGAGAEARIARPGSGGSASPQAAPALRPTERYGQMGAGAMRASDVEGPGTTLGVPTLAVGLTALALLWWLFLPGLYGTFALRVDPAFERTDNPIAGRPAAATTPYANVGPGTAGGGTFSTPSSVTPPSSATAGAVAGLLRLIKRTLPSNKQIDYAEEGIEARLIGLIEDRGRPLERTQWFEFDRLNFQTGSSNLTQESRAQVQNIADILSAYPVVRIKIGGYTDNVGDPSANQRLSEARAQRVMTELITLGINALRLEAEGYGDQHAIADNSTSEGRARNRRIAVRVTER